MFRPQIIPEATRKHTARSDPETDAHKSNGVLLRAIGAYQSRSAVSPFSECIQWRSQDTQLVDGGSGERQDVPGSSVG